MVRVIPVASQIVDINLDYFVAKFLYFVFESGTGPVSRIGTDRLARITS